jgi:hypothetical protein
MVEILSFSLELGLRLDEKLTAFGELESATQRQKASWEPQAL